MSGLKFSPLWWSRVLELLRSITQHISSLGELSTLFYRLSFHLLLARSACRGKVQLSVSVVPAPIVKAEVNNPRLLKSIFNVRRILI